MSRATFQGLKRKIVAIAAAAAAFVAVTVSASLGGLQMDPMGADSGTARIFIAQGDNNTSVDPWTFTTPDVVGAATLRIPSVGAAFNGYGGLLAGGAAALLVLVLLWPTTPKRLGTRREMIG